MRVSLISTVKDASAYVEDFAGSVVAQTRAPDEVIVVDGGSTDGTPELLRRAAESFTVIEERGANIARGRMVIPVGDRFAQQLYLLEKKNGQLKQSATLPVRFVPMANEAAEPK